MVLPKGALSLGVGTSEPLLPLLLPVWSGRLGALWYLPPLPGHVPVSQDQQGCPTLHRPPEAWAEGPHRATGRPVSPRVLA